MELSKEVVEKAAQAARSSYFTAHVRWVDLADVDRECWSNMMVAAAPFLQMPIAEVISEDEKLAFRRDYDAARGGTNNCLWSALLGFIRRRNAALQPKPDLREQIAKKITELSKSGCFSPAFMADRVLSLIDAHKGEK